MNLTRSQKKAQEAKDGYLANAEAILDFCLDKGMKAETALEYSAKPILFDDFLWLYEDSEDQKEFRRRLLAKLERTERNRILSQDMGTKDLRDM